MPDVEVNVLMPRDGQQGDETMASAIIADSLEAVVLTQAQGHAFTMEAQRLGVIEGKVGYREGLTHRIIGESGGGQSRSQQAAGLGGVPT